MWISSTEIEWLLFANRKDRKTRIQKYLIAANEHVREQRILRSRLKDWDTKEWASYFQTLNASERSSYLAQLSMALYHCNSSLQTFEIDLETNKQDEAIMLKMKLNKEHRKLIEVISLIADERYEVAKTQVDEVMEERERQRREMRGKKAK